MSIEIRTRVLKNGSQSLYLDCYENGKREYESLHLYLVPEVNEDAKRENKNAMKKAVAIKAERLLGIRKETKSSDETSSRKASPVFYEWLLDYHKGLIDSQAYSQNYIKNVWKLIAIMHQYMKYSHKSGIRLIDFNKNVYMGFLNYMRDIYVSPKSPSNPQKLAQSTMHQMQTTLNTILNKAVRNGLISANPFASLDIRERVSKAESNIVALTKEEVMSLASVETGSPATKQCYMFCCFTGLRHSDISNLKWKDIRQTDAGLAIYLPRMQKTKHPILIPLGKKALEWLPDKEDKSEDSLVFNTPQICNCDRALKHMAKRAGITKVLGFHTSRHTFGTLAILAGCDILTVSKLLGHKSVKTTQIYASVAMQMRADAVKRVEKVFGN